MHVLPSPMWILWCLMLWSVPLWGIRDPLSFVYFHKLFKDLVFQKPPTFLLKLVNIYHWVPEWPRGSGQTHVYVEHKDMCLIFIGNLATNLEWGVWWCVKSIEKWLISKCGWPKKAQKSTSARSLTSAVLCSPFHRTCVCQLLLDKRWLVF